MKNIDIYLDMDEVLVDFKRGTRELAGVTDSDSDDEMWEKIKNTPNFYLRCKPKQGSVEMVRSLVAMFGVARVHILSARPKPKRGVNTAKEDKIEWCKKYLPNGIEVNIVYREEKKDYCKGSNSYLVDDLKKNISEWESYGGVGILFTNPKEVLAQFKRVLMEGMNRTMMQTNMNLILEGLENSKNEQKLLNDIDVLRDDEYEAEISDDDTDEEDEDLESQIAEGVINEASIVTFGKKMYPRDGWAVVLAGGSGSGKSFARKTKIAIDAKVIDVDRLKELYIMALKAGKISDDEKKEYNLKNSDDVSALHQKVKQKGFKDEIEANFFNAYSNDKRPNVIYDITGDDPKKLEMLGDKLKGLGYKVSLVWIVTNRQVAMLQNLGRSRVVSQSVFHRTHNDVANTVFSFLKRSAKDYDEAWLVFASGESSKPSKDMSAEELKELYDNGAVKLNKKGSYFEIPSDVEDRLWNTLGPDEMNPNDPVTYKNFNNISKEDMDSARKGENTLLNNPDDAKRD